MPDRSIHHSQRAARRDWFRTDSAHQSAGARVHRRARESCEYPSQIFQGSRVEEISVRIPQALLGRYPSGVAITISMPAQLQPPIEFL